jgi:hypothetical protein
MAGKACGVGMNITSDQPFTVQLMHEGRSAHRCLFLAQRAVRVSARLRTGASEVRTKCGRMQRRGASAWRLFALVGSARGVELLPVAAGCGASWPNGAARGF